MEANIQNITTHAPATFNFKSAALNAYSRQIAEIGAEMASKNIQIAKILGKIMTEEAYKEDGFTSVQEYAEKVFGIKKSSAYQLANVGKRFYNSDSEAARKVAEMLPPANLAELKNMSDEDIAKEVESGAITPYTTQKKLREIASKHKEAKPATVEKTYDGSVKAVVGMTVKTKPFTNRVLDDILLETAGEYGFFPEAFKPYGPNMKVAVSSTGDIFLVSYEKHVTAKQAHDNAAKNGKVAKFTQADVDRMIAEALARQNNSKK